MRVEKKDDVVVVYLKGRVDAITTIGLEEKLSQLIDKGELKIILELSNVSYLSSSGLRLILSLLKKMEEKSGKLLLCSLIPEILNVIKISGFRDIVPIYGSEKECFLHI